MSLNALLMALNAAEKVGRDTALIADLRFAVDAMIEKMR